ncbi:MAG: pyrroline-5-carboxylate reductase [Candidatus Omnitrophota bacterium]
MKIGIIGCGNMGEAVLSCALKRRIGRFVVKEKDRLKEAFVCRTYHIKSAQGIADLVKKSDIVIIAVKPQDIGPVLAEIRRGIHLHNKQKILIISIAAGVNTKYIENMLSGRIRVIRAMPNIAATIGEGITAISRGRFATRGDLKNAKDIFDSVGETILIPQEGLLDVVTALSGSGPAYVFFIVNALLAAAEALGLGRAQANQLIYHTVIGSMHLNKKKGFDSRKLISQVASKGGTTEAALGVFQKERLHTTIYRAMRAAHKRAKELSR